MQCVNSFARPAAAQVFRRNLLRSQTVFGVQKVSPSVLSLSLRLTSREGERRWNSVQPAPICSSTVRERSGCSSKEIVSKRGPSLENRRRFGSSLGVQARASSSLGAANMAEGSGRPQATEYIVVYVTISNNEEGRKLAKSIVEAKLAACVNMVPGVESTYWWEGKVTTDSEVLLIIKTRQSLLGDLTSFVKANHPYELPEVISLPITGGNKKYLEWLGQSTERKGSE